MTAHAEGPSRRVAETAQQPNEEWYITNNFFVNGGRVYNGWGPFPTQELALRVRELLAMRADQ